MADKSEKDDRAGAEVGGVELRVPMPLVSPSIVLVGRFNPAIFQPAWMAANSLIRHEEATAAKGFIVVPELLTFRTAWLRIQVTDERFQAWCLEGGHEGPVRDLVLGIFALLEHTPFEQMGLNYIAHQALESEREYETIERRLNESSAFEGLLGQRSLRTLVVNGSSSHASDARMQIKVEPSVRVRPGLFVATNEHYDQRGSGIDAGRRLMDLLDKRWEAALAYGRRVVDHLHSLRREA